jgi:hypothetical protein
MLLLLFKLLFLKGFPDDFLGRNSKGLSLVILLLFEIFTGTFFRTLFAGRLVVSVAILVGLLSAVFHQKATRILE